MTDREPVDLRGQPECICPVEGPTCQSCPVHGMDAWRREWHSLPLYPVRTPRDAQGVTRTGYPFGEDEAEEEDVKF